MTTPMPPEEVVADALARAGGAAGMGAVGRWPRIYTRRAEAIIAELRQAGWLRDAPEPRS